MVPIWQRDRTTTPSFNLRLRWKPCHRCWSGGIKRQAWRDAVDSRARISMLARKSENCRKRGLKSTDICQPPAEAWMDPTWRVSQFLPPMSSLQPRICQRRDDAIGSRCRPGSFFRDAV